jgi:hypothetical protein
MGGGKYVHIPPLHSHAFKKIERGRHVPTPHLYILIFKIDFGRNRQMISPPKKIIVFLSYLKI